MSTVINGVRIVTQKPISSVLVPARDTNASEIPVIANWLANPVGPIKGQYWAGLPQGVVLGNFFVNEDGTIGLGGQGYTKNRLPEDLRSYIIEQILAQKKDYELSAAYRFTAINNAGKILGWLNVTLSVGDVEYGTINGFSIRRRNDGSVYVVNPTRYVEKEKVKSLDVEEGTTYLKAWDTYDRVIKEGDSVKLVESSNPAAGYLPSAQVASLVLEIAQGIAAGTLPHESGGAIGTAQAAAQAAISEATSEAVAAVAEVTI